MAWGPDEPGYTAPLSNFSAAAVQQSIFFQAVEAHISIFSFVLTLMGLFVLGALGPSPAAGRFHSVESIKIIAFETRSVNECQFPGDSGKKLLVLKDRIW